MSRSAATGERRAVLSRVLAAGIGGYALAALVSSLLALVLLRLGWATRADAVLWASLASFALYTGAALWVFAARSATRAWIGLALLVLPCALALWLL